VTSSPTVQRHRIAVRSADLGRRLDTFLVCAVAAVLGNRIFLVITGYPLLGNGTLHISHAIWGALMMMIALVAAIAFLPPSTRAFVAFLGGAGFGWFIDELGKFITRDVNYFFEPAIAHIYMTFVAMYLVFRALARRSYGPDEGLLNGIEALKAAAIGQLDEPARRGALALLDETAPTGPLALKVRALLEDTPALPARDPRWPARVTHRVHAYYLGMTDRPWFVQAVDTVFVLVTAVFVAEALAVSLDGPGITRFSERATVASSIVTGGLFLFGVIDLRRSRLRAYRWFERGLLVTIFVTQVFAFAEEQLAGVFGLAIALLMWATLRSAVKAEQERLAVSPST